jgi:hypothetical protein
MRELRERLRIGEVPVPPDGPFPDLSARERPEHAGLVEALRPSVIVEFGSWEGRSALAWLDYGLRAGLDLDLVCVDTWLGSAEHWLNEFPDSEWSRDRLKVSDGQPWVFDTFCNTILSHSKREKVTALRMTNGVAASIFRSLGLTADLVYVDGAHDFRSVVSDLLDAVTIVSSTGIVVGDDWGWPSVKSAALFTSVMRRHDVFTGPSASTYALVGRQPNSHDTRRELERQGWLRIGRMETIKHGLAPLAKSLNARRS